MPTFEIEQYEIHVQRFRVEANNAAEAIKKLFDGKSTSIDNSLELVEVCEDLGMSVEEFPELSENLRLLGVGLDEVIPSIRSVEEVG